MRGVGGAIKSGRIMAHLQQLSQYCHIGPCHDLNLREQIKPFRQWRFKSALLAEDGYRHFLCSQITLFFELNDLPETKRGTLWEALKAYIRSQSISFVSNLKKNETSHMMDLMQQIKDVDNKYSSDPDYLGTGGNLGQAFNSLLTKI